MGDTAAIGMGGSAGAGYVDDGDCNEMEGVCYGGAQPMSAPPASGAGTAQPVADDCSGDDPLMVCDSYDGYAEPEEFNNGNGPTRTLDPAYVADQHDKCVAEQQEVFYDCMEQKEHDARSMCKGNDKHAGRTVDNRPVEPGGEEACADGWVYGTDATQVADGANESTNEATTNGTSKQGGGGVKLGGKIGPVTIEGSGSGSYTKNESTTNGSSMGTTHTDATSKAARPGWDEQCQATYVVEVQRCDARPYVFYP